VGCGEVVEEGCGVTDGVLAVTDVGVSAVERETSLTTREDGETGRDGSEAVVELETSEGRLLPNEG